MELIKKSPIKVYATNWCGDCARVRRLFDEQNVTYIWIDIETDPAAKKFVEDTNHGFRSVPTIVFPDGSILVEPMTGELKRKLEG